MCTNACSEFMHVSTCSAGSDLIYNEYQKNMWRQMAEAVQKIDMFSWDTSFLSLLPSTFSKQLRKASSLQSVGSLDSTTMKTLGAFSLSQGTMKIPDGWADATLLNDTNGLNVVGDTIKAEVMNATS